MPFIGGDSDVGFGGGYIGSWARFGEKSRQYLFRLESVTAITFKNAEDQLEIPYVDSYVLLDLPRVQERLSLELRASYTREATLKYYGLGNASRIAPGREPEDDYFEHRRIHPTLQANAEYRLVRPLVLEWGLQYTQNWLEVPPDGRLAEDLRSQDPVVRKLLNERRRHAVLTYSYGLAADTRDNDVDPGRGQYHTLRLDWSPGGTPGIPHRWGRADLAARLYLPLHEHLLFAARLVGDFLLGAPPFYELSRYEDTSALGGVKGVRGIPAQRYYGKVKVLSNAELRVRVLQFRFLRKLNSLGLVAFFDSGRLWADYRAHPKLDGTRVGIKYGTGGGVRLAAGRSFVLRADVAWAREASPISGYLVSGHLF